MEEFYEIWMGGQDQFRRELAAAATLQVSAASDLRELVNRALAHYHSYYQERSRLAARDVLLLYNPPWLTPFERTFLWIAGWKPSVAFRLLRGSVAVSSSPLCTQQEVAVEELERDMAARVRALTVEMTRFQEVGGMPWALALAERAATIRNGNTGADEAAAVLEPLRILLGCADQLREEVVRSILGMLSPVQQVSFLAAVAEFHLRIRGWEVQSATA